jgi:regulator of cell morphogenesis and NO signaling
MKDKKIGEIVTIDIKTAVIFEKYGLDFCCGGGQTLEQACISKGVDIEVIISDINKLSNKDMTLQDFESMPLDELVDYIKKTHHKYIYENAQPSAEFIQKVANVHGERHPETIEIAKLYIDLLDELHQHMMKEEQILFPYIRRMVQEPTNNGAFINGPISVMETEHDEAGIILKKISKLSNDYEAPADGCNTYKAAYSSIKAMQEDIHLHIHLENNILFPKARKLEEQITT